MNQSVNIERKILLNPGPATTTDTVKMAQIVPDICPREQEFIDIMKSLRRDLVKVVHGNEEEYTAVPFCGSGTICMDVCLNSMLPESKKILIINNGAYSARAIEICKFYGLAFVELKLNYDEIPDLEKIKQILNQDEDIYLVYITHHETGTGLLNPVKEIGQVVHELNRVFVVDTTSSYALIPMNIQEYNIDFCMASAQKGLQAMTGLSYVIGNKALIEKSAEFPKRSYYCNLYLQYHFFEQTGEMHFTPPVQVIYSLKQALKEYFEEGEQKKWIRHQRTMETIRKGICSLGFKEVITENNRSNLVMALEMPQNKNWNFENIHDYCYQRGFTIYPGKIAGMDTFRLCVLGAIDEKDGAKFCEVFKEALKYYGVQMNA